MTPAPSVSPTTLATLARSHKAERDNTWVYSNGMYSFISEYDGRLVTVKPCRTATTLDYHGTHSLMRLDGNRCSGCNRVLDPNDDGAYNGRYRGGHEGWHSHDEDLNDPQIENQCP
ncbi:hypothetical protein ACET3X_009510 [Alternaria dauci]|uniref:Uncharacterized protein n=1 Tax=Alternaria dauci TaxID=48095 RepID=A0ABR3U787_9PLEO